MPTDYTQTHALARAIAAELGNGWAYDFKGSQNADNELHWFATLTDTGGGELSISAETSGPKAGKAHVRTVLPKRDAQGEYVSQDGASEITCAVSRGAVAIARDVKRRLLPGYGEALVKALQRIADSNAYAESGTRTTQRFVDAGLASYSQFNRPQKGYAEVYLDFEGHNAYGAARVAGASVEIKIGSLTIEQAIAAIRAIKAIPSPYND